jgi:hypothetical protein
LSNPSLRDFRFVQKIPARAVIPDPQVSASDAHGADVVLSDGFTYVARVQTCEFGELRDGDQAMNAIAILASTVLSHGRRCLLVQRDALVERKNSAATRARTRGSGCTPVPPKLNSTPLSPEASE